MYLTEVKFIRRYLKLRKILNKLKQYSSILKIYIGLKLYEFVLRHPNLNKDYLIKIAKQNKDYFAVKILEKIFERPYYRELVEYIVESENIKLDECGVPYVQMKNILPKPVAWTLIGFIFNKNVEKYIDYLKLCIKVKGVKEFLKNSFSEISSEAYLSESLSHTLCTYLVRKNILGKQNLAEEILRARFILYYEFTKGTGRKPYTFSTILSENFLKRVVDLAYLSIKDRVTVAPTIDLSEDLILSKKVSFTVVYGSLRKGFINALWDLAKDVQEYNWICKSNIVFSACHWRKLSVLEDRVLLTEGFIEKAGKVVYGVFKKFPEVKCVFFLSFPYGREISLHEHLSRVFSQRNVVQVNPYVSSKIADSKYLTNTILKKAKLNVPAQLRLSRSQKIHECLEQVKAFSKERRSPILVVKPEHGTEGIYGEAVDPSNESELLYCLHRILENDNAVVEELRGNIGYLGYPTVFRIVVSWNGEDFEYEGGYAIVSSARNEYIASVSHGGRIVDVNVALKNLYTYSELKRIDVDPQVLVFSAKKAAKALNSGFSERDYLKYMGVDLVLELRDRDIEAVVIEVNARPSGLSFLKRMDSGEANAIKNLLKYLERFE